MDSLPRIFVVGRSTLDLLLHDPATLPQPGELGALPDYHLLPGGSGLNTALALSYLGTEVTFATKVGRDPAGRLIREVLESRSIRLAHLGEDPSLRTSLSLIRVADDGEIGLLHHEGASRSLSLDEVSAQGLAHCEAVHVGGALFMEALDGEPCAELMRRSRRLGKLTSLGTTRNTPRCRLLDPVFPHLDVVFMNRKEALAATGSSSEEAAAQWLRARGVRQVVVTLGPDGCHLATDRFQGVLPALPVKALDTTGCGDAFAAGYLDAALRGLPPVACASWGNALGAHCARTAGAIVSPFDRREIQAMIELGEIAGGTAALILAGGRSRRMPGGGQKLGFPVCGKPVVGWVVEALRQAGVPRIVVLLGHGSAEVRASLVGQPVEFFEAGDYAAGTGSSVRAAVRALGDLPPRILVTNGDTPLLRAETLASLVRRQAASGAGAVAYTATSPDLKRYSHGLVHRGPDGAFDRVEHVAQVVELPASMEVNTGTYCFGLEALRSGSTELHPAADGEVHLSDLLAVLRCRGTAVELVHHPEFSELISVNTLQDLREVEERLCRSPEADRV